jgi:hypothetical protein
MQHGAGLSCLAVMEPGRTAELVELGRGRTLDARRQGQVAQDCDSQRRIDVV